MTPEAQRVAIDKPCGAWKEVRMQFCNRAASHKKNQLEASPMNQEQQRIKIAEACGWRWIAQRNVVESSPEFGFWQVNIGRSIPSSGVVSESIKTSLLPDYLNDLNAMNEAEKVLKAHGSIERDGGVYHNEQSLYVCLLLKVEQWPALGHDASTLFDLSHATAAQRAEAFLKTLNLWTE